MLFAQRTSLFVFALCMSTTSVALAQSDAPATETPAVGIRAFASSGRRAKAAAAKIEKAFADAWAVERTGDKFLGGRAPKYSSKDAVRAKAAATQAQKDNLTHIIDATITKRRSRYTVNLLLVGATGDIVARAKVTTAKVTAKAFAKAAKQLAAKIPEPPPPPPPQPEPTPEPEVAPIAAETAPADPAAEPQTEEAVAESGGGGFGSVLAGTGLFFLGSGVTALAAGAAFTGGAIMGRDWENKATLSSGLREEVNTAIFFTSLTADIVLVAGVVTALAGIGLLTTGLLIE